MVNRRGPAARRLTSILAWLEKTKSRSRLVEPGPGFFYSRQRARTRRPDPEPSAAGTPTTISSSCKASTAGGEAPRSADEQTPQRTYSAQRFPTFALIGRGSGRNPRAAVSPRQESTSHAGGADVVNVEGGSAAAACRGRATRACLSREVRDLAFIGLGSGKTFSAERAEVLAAMRARVVVARSTDGI